MIESRAPLSAPTCPHLGREQEEEMKSSLVCGLLVSLGVVACGGSSDDSTPGAGGASGAAGGATGGAGGATGGAGGVTGGAGGVTGGAGGSGGSTGGTGGAVGGAGGATGGSGGGPTSCGDLPSTVPLGDTYFPAYKSAYLCFTNDVDLSGNCTLETGLSKTGCVDASDVHLEFTQCQAGNPQCETGEQAVWTMANSNLQMTQKSAGIFGLNGSLTELPANTDVTLQIQSSYNSGEFYTVVFNFDGANNVTIKSFEPS